MTFGFHTFCTLGSDGSGSHCKVVSESVPVAPLVSTTVDGPYPNDFTYMLKTLSPSEAAASFKKQSSHTERWEVRCLRRHARFVCVVLLVLCL